MTESGGVGPTATSDVLAGTRWEIDSIDGEPVLPDVPLPITFGHDGRVSGSTGVNQLTASYTLNDQYLNFGPLATTRRAGDPALMAQEQRVLGSLAGICAYRLRPGSLSIDGPLGTVQLRLAHAVAAGEANGGSAAVAAPPDHVALRGTVRYDEELPVPFGATVIVQVRAGSTVVGEEILTDVAEVPVAFVVDVHPFDPSQPHHAMGAITVGGDVRWRSPHPVPVLADDAPVDLLLAIPE
jgi:heat shock protein HslJ